ncbi:MAG TPA: hypothetical protein VH477_01715 [Bryobacteraceae bacterium]|jgi:hypothetical protein
MAESIQNSGCLTVDQAKQKLETTGDLSCQELDDANKDARANELDPKATPDGYALTIAARKPANGPPKLMKAVSAGNAPKKEFRDGYQGPVKEKTRPACSGGGGYDAQRKNDSETKILDPEMRAGNGGSIKMKIFHQSPGENGNLVQDEMPCISCRKSICGANACGITVILCNKNNEEVPANEMCDGATPKGTGSTSDPLWVGKGFA